MVDSGPAVVTKATSKASTTERARRRWARLGDKVERMKCCSSGTAAAVFAIGATPAGAGAHGTNLIPRRGSSHEKAGSQSRPFCHLERRVTTHDAVGSNLPRARPTRIHQREIDRRNSKQRDHRWFLRVALHAVMVRSVSQDRPRHDLSVYDFGIWARRLMRSNRPPSWPLCAAPSSFEIR